MTLPVLPTAGISSEATKLHNFLKAVDPDKNGVGLDKVRPLYPKVGWNVVLRHVNELKNAGMVTETGVPNAKGGIGYNLYTWK